jgi:hypothetical protein
VDSFSAKGEEEEGKGMRQLRALRERKE